MTRKEIWDLLMEHAYHPIVIVTYGDGENPSNVALECEQCNCVLLDADAK